MRDFLMRILPARLSEEMERESRSWMVECPRCKHARSVWEIGGIRWRAVGTPSVYRFCPNCSQRGWHTMQRKGM